jgi:hypothetical protein
MRPADGGASSQSLDDSSGAFFLPGGRPRRFGPVSCAAAVIHAGGPPAPFSSPGSQTLKADNRCFDLGDFAAFLRQRFGVNPSVETIHD